MTKIEFIQELSAKLSEEMSPEDVLKEARYYEGYIDGEMARGKTEEESVSDLGSPLLIARNILDSPREESETISIFPSEEEEEAYAEGSYQGENQLSREDIRANALNGEFRGGEFSGEDRDEKEEMNTENPQEEMKRQQEAEREEEQVEEELFDDGHERTGDYDRRRQRAQGEEDYATPGKTDARGKKSEESESGWNLFRLILTLVIDITALVIIVRNVILSPHHALWLIVLVIVIAVLVIVIKDIRSGPGSHDGNPYG